MIMGVIIVLSLSAAVAAYISGPCAQTHGVEEKDTKLFGKIPWGLIGVIGYVLIAATVTVPFATPILASITALVTVWLMIEAYRIKLRCPLCPILWSINFGIAILALGKILRRVP